MEAKVQPMKPSADGILLPIGPSVHSASASRGWARALDAKPRYSSQATITKYASNFQLSGELCVVCISLSPSNKGLANPRLAPLCMRFADDIMLSYRDMATMCVCEASQRSPALPACKSMQLDKVGHVDALESSQQHCLRSSVGVRLPEGQP
ncbi:hypothetical protein CCMA1212_007765 [Trichoderma ghanense]|uniref:Uncharacterized protein n=1 Tax=Trichoderma ghanense TaxID=65468 RepID=A0ABY2GXR4_9HYPO